MAAAAGIFICQMFTLEIPAHIPSPLVLVAAVGLQMYLQKHQEELRPALSLCELGAMAALHHLALFTLPLVAVAHIPAELAPLTYMELVELVAFFLACFGARSCSLSMAQLEELQPLVLAMPRLQLQILLSLVPGHNCRIRVPLLIQALVVLAQTACCQLLALRLLGVQRLEQAHQPAALGTSPKAAAQRVVIRFQHLGSPSHLALLPLVRLEQVALVELFQ